MRRPERHPPGRGAAVAPIAVVTALTVVALALRARGMREGLYEDELYLVAEVRGHSFLQMLDAVANRHPGGPPEVNPPLFFSLAWLGSQAGDLTSTLRLPSVVLGSATVPLVYLLGIRTVGRPAAAVAAGLIALSPFAIFYGNEARAYATLMFVATLATLLLVLAAGEGRRRWWVAYAVATAALLYTHYTGVLVVAAHGAWVLWARRELLRPVLLAYVGVAVAYVPWLPHVHRDPADFGALAALMGIDHWDALLQWVAGFPRIEPERLPGTAALVLLGAGLAVGGASWARGGGGGAPAGRDALGLLAGLALVAPAFCLLYGLAGVDMFLYPRNMIASLPFAALLAGRLLTPPQRTAQVVAVGLAGVALGIGAARTLQPRFHRPDFRQAARLVERRVHEHPQLVLYGNGFAPVVLDRTLPLYARRLPPRLQAVPDETSVALAFARTWRAGRRSVVLVGLEGTRGDPWPPPVQPGWELRDHRMLEGAPPILVATYRPLAAGRPPSARAVAGVAGVLDTVARTQRATRVAGWALGPGDRPVRRVAAFAGDRLVAAGVPAVSRPDVAAERGIDADGVGFVLALPPAAGRDADVRVFAYAGGGGAAPLSRCGAGVRGFGC